MTKDEIIEELSIQEQRLRDNLAWRYADHEARLGTLPKDCERIPPCHDISVTLAEAAGIIGASKSTMRKWLIQYSIPHMVLNRQFRIRLSALRAWRDQRENDSIARLAASRDAG